MTIDTLLEEILEKSNPKLDKKIIKSFSQKNVLSPEIFDGDNGDYHMKKDIRDSLMKISDEFIDYIGVDFFVHDIVLTGSLANYNWSEFSDVDLHVLIDLDEVDGSDKTESSKLQTIVKEFFDLKKQLWNNTHDINVKGYEVELYVQDVKEKHLSSGVYSILNDKWVVEPKNTKESINKGLILKKAEDFVKKIDYLADKVSNNEDASSGIEDVRQKIKRFRQSGLDSNGEYSYENLTFKLLRRNGYIAKLLDLKNTLVNKKLSVAQ